MAKKDKADDDGTGEIHLDESTNEKEPAQSQELEKAKNDYLYLRAEFDNFRKNTIKERSDLIKYGAERFVTQILDVVDSFDLALKLEVTKDNFMDFKKGIEMTSQVFKSSLSSMGLTEIDPTGLAFDPSQHMALSSEETDEMGEGHVLRVFKKLIKLHDKVIRPAQVVVAKARSAEADESSGAPA